MIVYSRARNLIVNMLIIRVKLTVHWNILVVVAFDIQIPLERRPDVEECFYRALLLNMKWLRVKHPVTI